MVSNGTAVQCIQVWQGGVPRPCGVGVLHLRELLSGIDDHSYTSSFFACGNRFHTHAPHAHIRPHLCRCTQARCVDGAVRPALPVSVLMCTTWQLLLAGVGVRGWGWLRSGYVPAPVETNCWLLCSRTRTKTHYRARQHGPS